MKHWLIASIVAAAAVAGGYALHAGNPHEGPAAPVQTSPPEPPHPSLPPGAVVLDTPHYRIHSPATAAQTRQVAHAVEALYGRYAATFPHASANRVRLTLVLYRDRAEFKRNNRSRPWAEAYYLPPRSYAYFDAGARNPHHWMLHEATHQLMREVSAFPRAK